MSTRYSLVKGKRIAPSFNTKLNNFLKLAPDQIETNFVGRREYLRVDFTEM